MYQVDNGIYDVAIDGSTHPSTLYVTQDNGTFKSTDSGQSWTLIHSVLAGSRNRLSVVNSTLYLLGPRDPDHNLYKSIDRGATWTQIPTKCVDEAWSCAPPPILVLASRCSPWIPQSNVILGGNQALYRSDNGGLTWTEIEISGVTIHPAASIPTNE